MAAVVVLAAMWSEAVRVKAEREVARRAVVGGKGGGRDVGGEGDGCEGGSGEGGVGVHASRAVGVHASRAVASSLIMRSCRGEMFAHALAHAVVHPTGSAT